MDPPPVKAPEKPAKQYDYDFTDSLAGTGIDLSHEEKYAAEIAASYLPSARFGFPQLPTGGKSSFHGAGPASKSEGPASASLRQAELEAAHDAWYNSATKLAHARVSQLQDRFANMALLHARLDKIAGENGLTVNAGPSIKDQDKDKRDKDKGKDSALQSKQKQPPSDFPSPTLKVIHKPGEDGNIVPAYESYVPQGSQLAEIMALLSISAKTRATNIVARCHTASKHRQETAHAPPPDWADASGPLPVIDSYMSVTDSKASAKDISDPEPVIPIKRTASDAKLIPEIVMTLRDVQRQERNLEERRLQLRQKRQKGNSTGPSRAGSVAPGTPGTVAPEPEAKPLTKKEQKKQQKLAEQSTAATVNSTTTHFLFGRKKANRYSWMNQGGSTPGTPRPSAGGSGTPGPPMPVTPAALTPEGRTRMGTFREDGSAGKGIQIRDLIKVLEEDERDERTLQLAYDRLENPRVG